MGRSLPDPWQIPRVVALLAVAKNKSFTAAANELGVTKSVVSTHIKRLEEFIGARLLERSSRSLRLTEAGQRLVPHAEAMLASWSAAVGETRALTGEPTGKLVVSTSDLFGLNVVSLAVAQLVQLHPQVNVRLVVTDEIQHLINDDVDVAVRLGPVRDSNHLVRRLGRTSDILLASPSLVERRQVRDPDDLADLPWVRHSAFPTKRSMAGVGGASATFGSDSAVEVDSGACMLGLLLHGVGVGLMPELLVREHLRDKRLVRLLPEWSDPDVEIHALYPSKQLERSTIGVFLDLLAEHCRAS